MVAVCSKLAAPKGVGSLQFNCFDAIVALTRALRLRKRSDFQRVRQQGRVLTSRLLILAWIPNEQTTMRVGFVVSKRISKRAVDRNYIKRLLGEVMRGYAPKLTGGWDLVLSARHPILQADLPLLKQEIQSLLSRARLLSPAPIAEARTDLS